MSKNHPTSQPDPLKTELRPIAPQKVDGRGHKSEEQGISASRMAIWNQHRSPEVAPSTAATTIKQSASRANSDNDDVVSTRLVLAIYSDVF